MQHRYVGIAALLATLAVSSGCGLTSSPADGLTFAPPPGWQASPGIMGFMQFWKSPRNNQELLMLFKSPKPLQPSEVFSSAKLNDAAVEERRSIRICGNQPAEYLAARGTSTMGNDAAGKNGEKARTEDNVELIMTTAAGTTYFAMYVYPIDVRPNHEASAALRELCPKS